MSSSIQEIIQQPQTTDSSIFSHFPVEVVRLIFELSAISSDRTAASLVRVSKLVHSWVLPILYETIVVEHPWRFLNATSTLSSSSAGVASQHNLASLVRNICINASPAMPFPRIINVLLCLCSNLHNLYINDTHAPFRYPTGCHQHLKHLHCGSWDSWLNHDFLSFDSLTHLRVDLAYNNGIDSSWVPLLPPSQSLPHLTHLAIATDMRSAVSELRLTANFIRRILATRQGITLLILTVWFCAPEESSSKLSQIFAASNDPGRFCILTMLDSPHHGSSAREWQDEVRRGKSIWDKATAVIKRHEENGAWGIAIGTL